MSQTPGIKHQIEQLLKACSPDELTLGEIVQRLGLDKTQNSEISARLHKLRGEGKVRAITGPATSAKGPRFVKRYSAIKAKEPKPEKLTPAEIDDRRFLSLCR